MASLRLTTIERVNLALGRNQNDRNQEEQLVGLIDQVSDTFEAWIGREFLEQSRVEIRDMDRNQNTWWLHAFPIVSISEVLIRTGVWQDWIDATTVVTDDYDYEASTGRFILAMLPIWGGPLVVRFTYTAGFAADTDSFVTAYPSIASAADRQVAYEWKRREQLDAVTMNVGNATSMTVVNPVRLLPTSKEVLAAYRSVGIW